MIIVRPTADRTATGWVSTAGTAYEVVDETSYNDSDYVISPPLGTVAPIIFDIPSIVAGAYTIRVRAKSSGFNAQIRIILLNGSNEIQGISNWQAITNAFNTYSFLVPITVLVSKPGTPPPKVEKRTADMSVFQIDCFSILNTNEIIHGTVEINSPVLNVTDAKAKLGRYVRFKVEGGPKDVPYSDYLISFVVNTSVGSKLSIPINVRVYST